MKYLQIISTVIILCVIFTTSSKPKDELFQQAIEIFDSKDGDIDLAIKLLEEAAAGGNDEALLELATLYEVKKIANMCL
jgi:hypothetical protein